MQLFKYPAFLFCFLFLLTCSKEQQVWISAWKPGGEFGIARAGAALVVHKDYIYLIGGVDGREFLDSVVYAMIQSDGSLSSWQTGSVLNAPRGFTSAVVADGYLYVIGGGNGSNGENLLRSVEKAKIKQDGSLGVWELEKNQMVMPRRCSKTVVFDKFMYSFGGFGGSLLDTVERSAINRDGTLGEWVLEPGLLTVPRYVNDLKKIQNRVYVVGGHDQNKGVGITDVEWSSTDTVGHFDTWKTTTPLKTGRYGLSVASNGEFLFALGGLTGAEYVDSVETSRIDTVGLSGLGEWQFTTSMTRPRSNFNAVIVRDWIYVLGGTNRDGYLNAVEYAQINAQGNIGFWGTESQKKDSEALVLAAKQQNTNLPNQGIVAAVKQTSSYTYVQVYNEKQTTWIAGPKTDLKLNQRVRYSTGVLMTNFFSKELQLSFPRIVFVGTLQPE